ncbi:DUF979 domain-containing protein [Novosphingobium piscinae]|uniref:DUF979 domain-containing protein n=1 Tax=Novosphingobium piscinae TaxID=1507448 RepID=A0A7X1FVB2_9SPHN|nr:DUF979 domain-containing protein [Novosphingobium piscinae]MBC2667654.1 DUF979 domain-containing protein [Novosphingobium piscinae]
MITLQWVYALAGLFFAAVSLAGLRQRDNPRRWGTAAFWGLLALSMWAGDRIGDFGNGLLVIALTLIAGTGQLGRPADGPRALTRPLAPALRIFAIALIVPATALVGGFALKAAPALAEGKQATLIALALGTLLALAVGLQWLGARPRIALDEGSRLLGAVGWAAILPQMLASLGAVFALAGVGQVVGGLIRGVIPSTSLLAAVLAYGLGMALFTMVMGNAFAAFPVMMAAVGLPLLITDFHGDPAIICAIGMLAGFSGTLMTPMAANFNLVPAVLLGLRDRNGVVWRQVPTALPLLAINCALIYLLAFRP